ncbi:patatin-like phospholipase family protein [Paraglaciecola sp.]|uniref:patatin-like phospholipase family protein n=1 Tax=Paraglaciecola sp. TaxID=1920173 RepID=UPI00274009C2|nr:patatin-like phospholipase family protein [Paraglaciecola sp.]MDP5031219.1 patatin-like phospholipase family protein [Paraglaciecola sp.]
MKTALVLSGGGARGAYQVGVLKAIAEILPRSSTNPFQIVCGTSSGAINAAKVATEADNFFQAVTGLEHLWSNLTSDQIHQVGYYDIIKSSVKIVLSFFHSGIAQGKPLSLFNNRPLFNMLKRNIDIARLDKMIKEERIHALSISALGYTSGQNISFFQGHESLHFWKRSRRIGAKTVLEHKHLMASSALPAIFPAVHINREYFGDGALRQSAPMSSALHLGADKLLVIGVSGSAMSMEERLVTVHSPSIAQVLGNLLNSAFIDSLEEDVQMLERFNSLAAYITPEQQQELHIRPVELLVIKPKIKFEEMAMNFTHELPKSMRFLLSMIGANRKGGGSSLASYILFEREYCKALIQSGYEDAMSQAEEIRQFVGVCQI